MHGTPLTTTLLRELLSALTDPSLDRAWLGASSFVGAEFIGVADFSRVAFDSDVRFDGAEFSNEARFSEARFNGKAQFSEAIFQNDVTFNETEFNAEAEFMRTQFNGDARFSGAAFQGSASFAESIFSRTAELGPIYCAKTLDFSAAEFGNSVTIEAAANVLRCRRTRWSSTAALRLRYAAVDLSDAVVEFPVSVATRSRPFIIGHREMTEPSLAEPRVKVVSLHGVDAAHLILTNVDLTDCRFAGTIHLDQLRLEGQYILSTTPTGLRWRHGWCPVRWTPRRTLAEEHHWRASRRPNPDGWTPPSEGEEVLMPTALAPVYRQVRKSFEDGKHEPGAADFYYGEMEMRRHADDIPQGERTLLHLYWALSGYGLRASRAFCWLLSVMTGTILLMMLWGLPQENPKPISTGTLNGNSITVTTVTADPLNPEGPFHQRVSSKRFEKSLRVVIESALFRSSGQELTTAGTYIEMTSRLTEPMLLGFAVMAVRGRVKR